MSLRTGPTDLTGCGRGGGLGGVQEPATQEAGMQGTQAIGGSCGLQVLRALSHLQPELKH